MARSFLVGTMLAVLMLVSIQGWSAANEIMVQPGPGVNDGSDDGSEGAGKDAFTNGTTPEDRAKSYGASPTLHSLPKSTCNTAMARAFIRFAVDFLPADVEAVYLGVTHLPHTNHCYSNCSADFYFYPVLEPWDEMTLTYDLSPKVGKAVHGPIRIQFPNDLGVREYDITDLYREWKSGALANHGIAIFSPTAGCNNAAVFFAFYSSDEADASRRPYLRIVPRETAGPAPEIQETQTASPEPIQGQGEIGAAGPEQIPGQGDGGPVAQGEPKRFKALDALNALRMSTRNLPESMDYDADRDGQITSSDARLILQKVVGK